MFPPSILRNCLGYPFSFFARNSETTPTCCPTTGHPSWGALQRPTKMRPCGGAYSRGATFFCCRSQSSSVFQSSTLWLLSRAQRGRGEASLRFRGGPRPRASRVCQRFKTKRRYEIHFLFKDGQKCMTNCLKAKWGLCVQTLKSNGGFVIRLPCLAFLCDKIRDLSNVIKKPPRSTIRGIKALFVRQLRFCRTVQAQKGLTPTTF